MEPVRINLMGTFQISSGDVTLREKENGIFKISLRTNDELNASDICKKFGGGGHPAAAGCTIHGGLENAKKSIVEAISDEIKRKL